MSSAGKIFEEKIYVVSEPTSGSKTINLTIENDGCVVVIERISGSATVSGTFKTNLPDPMSELVLETFSVSTGTPLRFAHITGAQVAFDLGWDGPTEFRIAVKMANGSGVAAVNPQVIIIDTFDGFATQKVSVGTSVVQVVNTADRKSIGIRNWADLDSNLTLYVKENNADVVEGWPLAPGEGLSLDIDESTSLYLVASSDTIDTRILEVTNS